MGCGVKWLLIGVGVYFGVAWLKGQQVSASCFPTATDPALNANQIQVNCDAAKKQWAWFIDPSRMGS